MQLICKNEIRKHAGPEQVELLVFLSSAWAINCIGPVVLESVIIIIPSVVFTQQFIKIRQGQQALGHAA